MISRATGLLALVFAMSACNPTSSMAPTGAAASPAPGASAVPPPPGATTAPGSGLAEALGHAISVDDILADLGELGDIAAANGGHRAAGSAGYDQAATFVADQLRSAGYAVELQPVDLFAFQEDSPTIIEIVGPDAPPLQDTRDVKAMLLSPSGDVTGQVFALGFDPAAQPGDRNGTGCDSADWAGAPRGVVALVQPGRCPRRDVVVNAQTAGAMALITAYPEWTPDRVLRPTLLDPDGLTIPAVGVTNDAGLALLAASRAGAEVHVAVHTTVKRTTSPNVIAETPGGDSAHVVVLGGHLDSVIDGPGANDNGSGTMTTLEIARELARLRPGGAPWKVRFGFWTGEEVGLIGSTAYLGALETAARESIVMYLNLDMLGSPNGVRLVYDASASTHPTEGAAVAALFGTALDQAGLAWDSTAVGTSDHAAFDQWLIPYGGLFAGANERKTDDQAARFGGTAGVPADACFHLACDTIENIDRELLEQLARAAGWVVGRLASGEVVLSGS